MHKVIFFWKIFQLLSISQHVSTQLVCMDTAVVFDAWNCTAGYYVHVPSTITNTQLVCPSCTQNTLGIPSVVGMPTNAHYTGPSPVISFDKCPWQCNTGLSQTLGFCYPGADCSVYSQKLQLYSTVRNCDIVSPCPSGSINAPASANVLTAHSTRFTALLMHNLADSTVSGAAGRQCLAIDDDTGNLDGNFSTATFRIPLLAQQSGGSDLTAVFDMKYLALKTINRTSQQIKTIAGGLGNGTASVDGVGTAATFSTPLKYTFLPATPGTNYYVSAQLAVNHNATAALIFDKGLMRFVNLSTGQVTTLTGQSGVLGYAEGTGQNVLYTSVSAISLSPDASFALVLDISMTVRYLNISTRTSSLLAGAPGKVSSIDGIGTSVHFCYPRAVAVSNSGNFALIGDCGNPTFNTGSFTLGYPTIRYLNISTGAVTTIGGQWNRRGGGDSYVISGTNLASVWCPLAITIASDDSYAVFLDDVNFALRTIDLTTYRITTLDKLGTAYDTPDNSSFPTSISNILGTGNSIMSPTCQPCPAGTYQTNSACTPCAPGTYSPSGASQCTPCAQGYTSSSPTGGSIACVQCSAGTYNSGAGACTPCTPGTYSHAAAANCTPCAAGTYDTSLTGGSNTCTSCSAGTYNTGLGNMVGTPSANVRPITATYTGLPVPLNAGDYCSYPVAESYPEVTAANNAASASMVCNKAQCPWPVGQYCQFVGNNTPTDYIWHCTAGCAQTNRCYNIYNAFYTGPGTTIDTCPYQCNPGFNNPTLDPSLGPGFVCYAYPPCAQCPAGTYSDSPGATVCKNCPTSSSCSNGYYLSGCGGSSAGSCVRCTN